MPKNVVVIGPPGTGKTTAMILAATEWFKKGAGPHEVAYLAFTRAAANEAASRIMDEDIDLGLQPDEKLPHFRTIHSLAYRSMMRDRKGDVRLATPTDMKAFAAWSGYEGSYAVTNVEDLSEVYQNLAQAIRSDYDRLLTAYSLSRISASTPAELAAAAERMSRTAARTVGYIESGAEAYKTFVSKYEEFKERNGLIDFTDMLAYALTEMAPLESVRYAVVDECLPAGTPIRMADGSRKPVERVTCGDTVLGYDHAAGTLREAVVLETRSRPARRLVRINGELELTENHPVYVPGKGYVEAGTLCVGDPIVCLHVRDMRPGAPSSSADLFESVRGPAPAQTADGGLCEMRSGVRADPEFGQTVLFEILCLSGTTGRAGGKDLSNVRNAVEPVAVRGQEEEVLLEGMRWTSTHRSSEAGHPEGRDEADLEDDRLPRMRNRNGVAGTEGQKEQEILQREVRREEEIHGGRPAAALRTHEDAEPDEGRACPLEGDGGVEGGRASAAVAGGQRQGVDGTPEAHPGETQRPFGRLDSRIDDPRLGRPGLEEGGSGSGPSAVQDRGGSGRAEPWRKEAENHRREKGRHPPFDGMGSPAVQKFGHLGGLEVGFVVDSVRDVESVNRGSEGVRVYNIGTATQNYFAHDVLVHNCQDLAPILHSIVDRCFQSADECWYAGDPNQAIYNFAAADARLFIDLAERADVRITLRQTHRFGQEVVDFSSRIIRRARDRMLVDVIGKPGARHRISRTGEFSPTVGPMLVLHRHVMGCQALAAAYMAEGKPFRCERGKDPLGHDMRVEAFKTMHQLAAGGEAAAGSVIRLVDDLMRSVLPPDSSTGGKAVRLVVHGGKKRLQEGAVKGEIRLRDLVTAKILTEEGSDAIRARNFQAFKGEYVSDFEYYRKVVDNGYSLETVDSKGELIVPVITTIHGSKGRQAPKVTVFSELGQKCKDDMDNEHRLAFVASTRTEGDLDICAERKVDWAEEKYEYPVEEKGNGGGAKVGGEPEPEDIVF